MVDSKKLYQVIAYILLTLVYILISTFIFTSLAGSPMVYMIAITAISMCYGYSFVKIAES